MVNTRSKIDQKPASEKNPDAIDAMVSPSVVLNYHVEDASCG